MSKHKYNNMLPDKRTQHIAKRYWALNCHITIDFEPEGENPKRNTAHIYVKPIFHELQLTRRESLIVPSESEESDPPTNPEDLGYKKKKSKVPNKDATKTFTYLWQETREVLRYKRDENMGSVYTGFARFKTFVGFKSRE